MEAGRAAQYGPVAEVLKAMQAQAAGGSRVVPMPRAAGAATPVPAAAMEARS